MKTKILSIFAIMLAAFTLVFSMPIVIAQTSDSTSVCSGVEAGVTPDSPFYFTDGLLEDISLSLTSDNDKKVAKELETACEKLAEVNEMALEGDADSMTKANEKYGEVLAELKGEIQDIQADTAKDALKKQLELEKDIEDLDNKVEVISDSLKIKIETEGAITPEQQALIDSILANLDGMTGEVKIEIENEKGKTKIKIEFETGEDGDDVEDELEAELDQEDDSNDDDSNDESDSDNSDDNSENESDDDTIVLN